MCSCDSRSESPSKTAMHSLALMQCGHAHIFMYNFQKLAKFTSSGIVISFRKSHIKQLQFL